MKLYTKEWKEAAKRLAEPLRKYHKSRDMGGSLYTNDERYVSIKHRMRKDKISVVSLGCFVETGEGVHDYPDIKWFVTTAIPLREQADKVSSSLLAYLEKGQIPTLDLPTYPGYEDWDIKR